MKLQNYIKRLLNNQLTIRIVTLVQNEIGNMIKKCNNIGVSFRDFQTRLKKALTRGCSNTSLFYIPFISKPSNLSHGEANILSDLDLFIRPSNNDINQPYYSRGNTIMKKLIIALLSILLLGFMISGGIFTIFNSLSIAPFLLGITFRRKSNNTKILPDYHTGLTDSDMNKEDFIKERVDQVNKVKLYDDQVNRVTRQAEEQWNDNHPDFTRIQRNIIDNSYCDLVSTYRESGLSYPEAFTNTLVAIVRKYGVSNGDNLYSFDKTVGQFAHYVESELCLDCHASESGQIINSILKLRDEYGVTFNKPSLPITSMEDVDNIVDDIIDLDYEDEDEDDEEIIDLDEHEDDDELDSLSSQSTPIPSKIEKEPATLTFDASSILTPLQKATQQYCAENNPNCASCVIDVKNTLDDNSDLSSIFG